MPRFQVRLGDTWEATYRCFSLTSWECGRQGLWELSSCVCMYFCFVVLPTVNNACVISINKNIWKKRGVALCTHFTTHINARVPTEKEEEQEKIDTWSHKVEVTATARQTWNLPWSKCGGGMEACSPCTSSQILHDLSHRDWPWCLEIRVLVKHNALNIKQHHGPQCAWVEWVASER